MCELMAMSALHETNITHSLAEFRKHGGETNIHDDGWGVAYYNKHDIRLFREPDAAAFSQFLAYVAELEITSKLVVAHIREANVGSNQLCNTHPFSRELGGRQHSFAHNGQMPAVLNHADFKLGRFKPIGGTDSEHVFCVLLHRLEALWQGDEAPSLEQRLQVVTDFACEIRLYGPANFVYTDSEYLYIHADQRLQTDGIRKPPGLFALCRRRYLDQCSSGSPKTAVKDYTPLPRAQPCPSTVARKAIKPPDEQRVVLVSTVPLSDEDWMPFNRGDIMVIKEGEVIDLIATFRDEDLAVYY